MNCLRNIFARRRREKRKINQLKQLCETPPRIQIIPDDEPYSHNEYIKDLMRIRDEEEESKK